MAENTQPTEVNIIQEVPITDLDIMNYINELNEDDLFLFLSKFSNFDSIPNMNDNLPEIVINYLEQLGTEEQNAFISEMGVLFENTISKYAESLIAPQQKTNDELIVKSIVKSLMNGEITAFNSKRLGGTSIAELKQLIEDSAQKVQVKTSTDLEIYNGNIVRAPSDIYSIIGIYVLGANKEDQKISFDWELINEEGILYIKLDTESVSLVDKYCKIVYVPTFDTITNTCPNADKYANLDGSQSLVSDAINYTPTTVINYNKNNRTVVSKETTLNMPEYFGFFQFNFKKNNHIAKSTMNQIASDFPVQQNISYTKSNRIIKNVSSINLDPLYKSNNIYSERSFIVKSIKEQTTIDFDLSKLSKLSFKRNSYINKSKEVKEEIINIYDYLNFSINYNNTYIAKSISSIIDMEEEINIDINFNSYTVYCDNNQNSISMEIDNNFNTNYANTLIVSQKEFYVNNIDFEILDNLQNNKYQSSRIAKVIGEPKQHGTGTTQINKISFLDRMNINYSSTLIAKSIPGNSSTMMDDTSDKIIFDGNYIADCIDTKNNIDISIPSMNIYNPNKVAAVVAGVIINPVIKSTLSSITFNSNNIKTLSTSSTSVFGETFNDCPIGAIDKVLTVTPKIKMSDLCKKTPTFILDKEFKCHENQTLFTNLTYNPGFIMVILEGKVLPEEDFIAIDCNNIELTVPAREDDTIRFVSFSKFDIANTYSKMEINNMISAITTKTSTPLLYQEEEEINEGSTTLIEIRDFDQNMLYKVTCTAGEVSRSGHIIKFTAPIIDSAKEDIPDSISIINVTATLVSGGVPESEATSIFYKIKNYDVNYVSLNESNTGNTIITNSDVVVDNLDSNGNLIGTTRTKVTINTPNEGDITTEITEMDIDGNIINSSTEVTQPIMNANETISIGDTITNKQNRLKVSEFEEGVTDLDGFTNGDISTDLDGTEKVVLTANENIVTPLYENEDEDWLLLRPITQHRPNMIGLLSEYSIDGALYQTSETSIIITKDSDGSIPTNLLLAQEYESGISKEYVANIEISDDNIVFENNIIAVINLQGYGFDRAPNYVFRNNTKLLMGESIETIDNSNIKLNINDVNTSTNEIILSKEGSADLIKSNTENSIPTGSSKFSLISNNTVEYGITKYDKVEVHDIKSSVEFTDETNARYNYQSAVNYEDKSLIYLAGGFDKDGNVLTSIISYNLISKETKSVSYSLPKDISEFSMNYRNNKLYIIGGKDNTTNLINTDLLIYDLKTKLWQIRTTNLPKLHKHKTVEYNYKIYIIGGELGEIKYNEDPKFNTLLEYDLLTNRYIVIEAPGVNDEYSLEKFSRVDHKVCIISDEIYIIGGYNENKTFNTSFYKYSINKQSFTKYEDELVLGDETVIEEVKKLLKISMTTVGDKIYISGGSRYISSYVTKPNSNIYCFNTFNRTWSRIEVPETNHINTNDGNNLFGLTIDGSVKLYNLFGYNIVNDINTEINNNLSVINISNSIIRLYLNGLEIDATLKQELIDNGIYLVSPGVNQVIYNRSYDSIKDILTTTYNLNEYNKNSIIAKFINTSEIGKPTGESKLEFFSLDLQFFNEIE